MHIRRLTIANLRSIERAELELNAPGDPALKCPNVNVLLGGNGMGKTSVLRAAALSVLGPLLSSSSGYVPESLIRRPPGTRGDSSSVLDKLPHAALEAEVVVAEDILPPYAKSVVKKMPVRMHTDIIRLGTAERLRWKCDPQEASGMIERLQFDERAAAFFVVAYGATRRVETSTRVDESARIKTRLRRYERVSSLFEDHIGLMPLSYWLPGYASRNRGRYTQVFHLMNELLPEACRMMESVSSTATGKEHLFNINGVSLPFRALSDGYRAYIGWIGDMLFHLCMGAPTGGKLRDTRGIVLLDEVDLHLHPEWQRVVVPTLANALPHVQFLITTHSPLVVGSLEAGNLFVLGDRGDGTTEVKRLPEKVHGRSAEQILLSPYFGLASTRAPEVSDQLGKLASDAVAGDAKASLRYLELLSQGLPASELVAAEPAPAPRPAAKRRPTLAKKAAT